MNEKITVKEIKDWINQISESIEYTKYLKSVLEEEFHTIWRILDSNPSDEIEKRISFFKTKLNEINDDKIKEFYSEQITQWEDLKSDLEKGLDIRKKIDEMSNNLHYNKILALHRTIENLKKDLASCEYVLLNIAFTTILQDKESMDKIIKKFIEEENQILEKLIKEKEEKEEQISSSSDIENNPDIEKTKKSIKYLEERITEKKEEIEELKNPDNREKIIRDRYSFVPLSETVKPINPEVYAIMDELNEVVETYRDRCEKFEEKEKRVQEFEGTEWYSLFREFAVDGHEYMGRLTGYEELQDINLKMHNYSALIKQLNDFIEKNKDYEVNAEKYLYVSRDGKEIKGKLSKLMFKIFHKKDYLINLKKVEQVKESLKNSRDRLAKVSEEKEQFEKSIGSEQLNKAERYAKLNKLINPRMVEQYKRDKTSLEGINQYKKNVKEQYTVILKKLLELPNLPKDLIEYYSNLLESGEIKNFRYELINNTNLFSSIMKNYSDDYVSFNHSVMRERLLNGDVDINMSQEDAVEQLQDSNYGSRLR